jgi:hypothetical protein
LIYFARIVETPLVKIGCTRRPIRARLRAIEKQYNRRVALLAVMDGGMAKEKEIHKRFDHLRFVGGRGPRPELFRLSSDLIRFIYHHGFDNRLMKKGRQRFGKLTDPARETA